MPCILFLKTWYDIKTQVENFTQVYEMFTQIEMLGLFWPDFLDPKKLIDSTIVLLKRSIADQRRGTTGGIFRRNCERFWFGWAKGWVKFDFYLPIVWLISWCFSVDRQKKVVL